MARFILNPLAGQEIAGAAGMRELMALKAEKVKAEAKRIAPVETGRYRDSIESDVKLGDHGWEAEVSADAPYAIFLEVGTSDTPTFATLRTALEQAGEE